MSISSKLSSFANRIKSILNIFNLGQSVLGHNLKYIKTNASPKLVIKFWMLVRTPSRFEQTKLIMVLKESFKQRMMRVQTNPQILESKYEPICIQ